MMRIDLRLWAAGMVILAVLLLSGCLALPIAALGVSAAGTANVMVGDQGIALHVEPEERAKIAPLLKGSKRIVLLDSGPATATAAETIEQDGRAAPVASQYGNSAKMSPSQQKETMAKACVSERGDAVISARTGDTRTNKMTYFIGKASTELDMSVHVLNCRTKDIGTAKVLFKFDAMTQGSEEASYRRAGVTFGKLVIELSLGT